MTRSRPLLSLLSASILMAVASSGCVVDDGTDDPTIVRSPDTVPSLVVMFHGPAVMDRPIHVEIRLSSILSLSDAMMGTSHAFAGNEEPPESERGYSWSRPPAFEGDLSNEGELILEETLTVHREGSWPLRVWVVGWNTLPFGDSWYPSGLFERKGTDIELMMHVTRDRIAFEYPVMALTRAAWNGNQTLVRLDATPHPENDTRHRVDVLFQATFDDPAATLVFLRSSGLEIEGDQTPRTVGLRADRWTAVRLDVTGTGELNVNIHPHPRMSVEPGRAQIRIPPS